MFMTSERRHQEGRGGWGVDEATSLFVKVMGGEWLAVLVRAYTELDMGC